jgi:hypothetical protein
MAFALRRCDRGAVVGRRVGGGLSRRHSRRTMRALVVLVGLLAALAAGPAATDTDARLAAIDAQARAAPASSAMSVSSLALYLQQRTRDDREKARAAFTWIAQNVAYDASLRNKPADAKTVLAQRRAACYGYAVLFEALVEAMGLEAEIVAGHGKGQGFEPGHGMESAQNHAWSAVKTGGGWGLVDCAWGAGYTDDQGRFVRRFTDHYFLTPPDEFVYDHFPDDARWQLLGSPISRTEYLNRVHVKPVFFERGLRLVSYGRAGLRAESSLQVTIGAPPDTVVTADLYQGGRQLGRQYTFTQREAKGFVARAVFPTPGSYLLRVFAREREAAGGKYEMALQYAVEARAGSGKSAGFPETYDTFLARDCRLGQPLTREIPAGRKVQFSLSVPGATDVVVVRSDDVWWMLDKRGDGFSGEVLTEAGDVTVFAKFRGRTRYDGLLKYAAK